MNTEPRTQHFNSLWQGESICEVTLHFGIYDFIGALDHLSVVDDEEMLLLMFVSRME
jgi:hypothetical protein